MRSDRLLLDTCAVIWIATDARLSPETEDALNASARSNVPVAVCAITAWELGLLAAKGKLPATQGEAALFDDFISRPGISLQQLTPDVLIASSFLPGDFHSDPADRIIVATARALDLRIVTRDTAMLRYAEQGYIRALRC